MFLTKEELSHLYLTKNLNTKEIADLKNCKRGAIFRLLHFYGLKIKSISESKIGRKIKPCSEERKKEISNKLLGRKMDWGEKLSDNAKNNPNYGMKGKHHSKEIKDKIRQIKLGEPRVDLMGEKNPNWKGGKVKLICTICKKECYVKPYRISNFLCCSTKCRLEYLKREIRPKIILPVKDTSIELKIQSFLKQLGIEFFTHQYMKEIEHGYQCDILIPSLKMVIECDGNYWHKYPIGNELDHIRTKELLENGFKVLRLWEFEINSMTIENFKERIENARKP
jgi:very-short-patch-repair endonuclease/predicted DNA-binding protein YlxM (UPF0122 family)